MSSKPACGPATEIASNEAVRVARCSCGTVHVTVIASGVTIRMPIEAFRKVASGFEGAIAKLETTPATITSTGSTSIN
jgi:hypothetical protein